MTAKIQFKTTQTRFGKVFEGRVTGHLPKAPEKVLTAPVFPARPWDVSKVHGKVMAENGTAWAYGRNAQGMPLIWKSIKLSKRFGQESYRMRSVKGGYKGDYVTSWSRVVNGKTYSFSIIKWNGGKDGVTTRIYAGQSTKVIHEWFTPGK